MTLLLGALCGLFCLIPGVGLMVTAIICSIIAPGGEAYALSVGIIALSFNEAIDPSSSGGIYTSHEVCSHRQSIINLCSLKVTSLIIGCILGCVIPNVLGGTFFMTCIAVGLILWEFAGTSHMGAVLGWVLAIQAFMEFLDILGVSNPIVVVSMCIFTIPSILMELAKDGKGKEYAYSTTYEEPDLVVTLFGGIFALCAPGVSGAAIVSTFVKSDMKEMSTNVSTEALTEGIALSMIMRGNHLGKTMMGTIIQSIDFHQLVGCVILMGCTFFLVCLLSKLFRPSILASRFIASCIGTITLFYLVGNWVLLVLPIGLCLWSFRLWLPQRAVGLTFLSLILS